MRSVPAWPGARFRETIAPASAGRGLRAVGPRDFGWRRLLPSSSLRLPPRPRSRPRRSPPGVLRAGSVSWLRAEQRGRAASSHSRCSGHRHPLHGAQAASAAAARASTPGPPRWIPPPLLHPGTRTSRVRAGVETPGPCARLGGGRRRQSRGIGTPEGAGSDGLGSAAATPLGIPRPPDPAAPREHRPSPPSWVADAPAPPQA